METTQDVEAWCTVDTEWKRTVPQKCVEGQVQSYLVIVSILAARSRVKLSSALFFLLKVLSSCLGLKPIVFYFDLECLLCSNHFSCLDMKTVFVFPVPGKVIFFYQFFFTSPFGPFTSTLILQPNKVIQTKDSSFSFHSSLAKLSREFYGSRFSKPVHKSLVI